MEEPANMRCSPLLENRLLAALAVPGPEGRRHKVLKFYDQTSFTDRQKGTYGDCMSACIRTVLQMDLDAFVNHGDKSIYETYEDAWKALIKALSLLGFVIRYQALANDAGSAFFPRIVIMAGASPRNIGVKHAVVWNRDIDKLLHDPHPSRGGLTSPTGFYYLTSHADAGGVVQPL